MIQWNRVVIISGPSGVGKDTLIAHWMEQNPALARIRTCTTRKPRQGEVHGVHYFFLDHDEFEAWAIGGKLMEHKWVHSNRYGSPLSEVERIQAEGKIPLVNIDVQGAIDLLEKHPQVISIFVLPPSIEELRNRIFQRATDSEEQIAIRLKTAHEEIAASSKYRYQVVNDTVNDAVNRLEEMLQKELAR